MQINGAARISSWLFLRQRKKVYEKAKQRHPERWAKEIRNWAFSEEEWLNPKQEKEAKNEARAS